MKLLRLIVSLGLFVAVLAFVPTVASAEAGDPAPRENGVDLNVASFNIKNVSFARKPAKDWAKRRAVIIDEVLRENVDVLGIQEANPGRYLGIEFEDGPNQYIDLKNGLNQAGGHYRLTNPHSWNCVNPLTWQNCVFKDRSASRSDRILYNTEKLELVSRGSVLYKKQSGPDPRYLAWAVLEVKSTGTEVFVTTTHLTSGDERARKAQWRQMIRKINALKGNRPVIVTGDLNVQKYHPIARTMLPAMKDAGYGDVLNQVFSINPIRFQRAESTVNGWLNSYNHGRRDVSTFGFSEQREKAGNNIDWIFASNDLRVKEWKVVLDFDWTTLKVNGVLPSDHNMVRATITIPG